MIALLGRIELAAAIGVVLVIVLLLSCARASPTDDLQREADALRVRTLPPHAMLVSSAPAAIDNTGRGSAVWLLESEMDWPAYREWLVAELRDYTCASGEKAAPDERAGFLRYMHLRNELWMVVAMRLDEPPRRVRVEFSIVPD